MRTDVEIFGVIQQHPFPSYWQHTHWVYYYQLVKWSISHGTYNKQICLLVFWHLLLPLMLCLLWFPLFTFQAFVRRLGKCFKNNALCATYLIVSVYYPLSCIYNARVSIDFNIQPTRTDIWMVCIVLIRMMNDRYYNIDELSSLQHSATFFLLLLLLIFSSPLGSSQRNNGYNIKIKFY